MIAIRRFRRFWERFFALPGKGMPVAIAACGCALLVAGRAWAADSAQAAVVPLDEPAAAADSGTPFHTGLTVYYEMYIGGLQLGYIDVKASWNDDRYEIDSKAQTAGIAETLFEGRYNNVSEGVLAGAKVSPRLYISDYSTTDNAQYVKVSFNGDEPTALLAKPPYDLRYPVDRELKRKTVDPLGAYMYLMFGSNRSADAPCGRTLPIFDGKRRYDFKINYVKEIRIRSGDKHAYRGPGVLCEMQYTQVAGYKPRDKDSAPFPLMKVHLAKIEGGRYMVPVKFVIETDYGAIVGSARKMLFSEGTPVSDHG